MKKIIVVGAVVLTLLYFFTPLQENGSKQSKDKDSSSSNLHDATNRLSQKNISNLKDAIESPTEPSTKLNKTNTAINQLEPEIKKALKKHLNTSSEGLVEEKTDRGVSVDLQGRFQTVPVATINEKGELEIRHFSNLPTGVSE